MDIHQAITNIYEIWNRMESSIIYKCWVQTGLVTDNSTVGRTNFHNASNFNSGSVSDIVFNSFYLDKDLCYDSTK